jgi:hypothetical protein
MHYFVDGPLAGTGTTLSVDFGVLSVGAHSIKAELHNNDHSLYTDAAHPQGFNATVVVNVAGTSIAILNPVNNAAVGTSGFRMEVRVQGFDLSASNYGGTNVLGQGHIHYLEGASLLGATASTTFDTGALAPGTHVIKAELHNNDHSLFTDASHTFGFNATITVTASNPSLSIVSPATNSAVSNSGFRITVAVAGLVLDAENYGGANIPGHGHVHFYEGTQLLGTSTTTWFDATLATGTHTIRAELRNNDHSPLSPAVSAQVVVKVGPPELKILEPVGTSTVSTLGFRMRFAVANFSLDPQDYGGAAIPGQGHIHVYLGTGTTQLLATTVFDQVVITIQAPGAATLRVELRNNDHTALTSPVFATVAVAVALPSISVSAPSSITTGEDLKISWTVSGFVLDSAAFGGAPEPGRGHVHVFVDGTYVAATAATSYVITGLSTGVHNISVLLFNNNHSPLATEFSSKATVTVASVVTPATVTTTVYYGSVGLLAVIVVVLAALLVRKGRKGPPESKKPEEGEL